MKYVIDTCILNKLIDGQIEAETLPADGDFVASHIQIDELNRTKDEDRRARLFLKFDEIVDEVLPTESAILGISRIGEAKLGDGNLYASIKNQLDTLNGGKQNNSMDALIAEVAIKNGYTLLTADYHLNEVVKKDNGQVRYWQT